MPGVFPSNDELHEMIDQLRRFHSREREEMITSIDLLGALHRGKAEARLRMSPREFAETVGLTVDMYFKRLQVFRTMGVHPKIRQAWEAGEISFSHIVAMAPRVTEANTDLMLFSVKGKTKNEARAAVARITREGQVVPEPVVVDLRLRFGEKEMELLQRAREVMAHGGHVPSIEEVVRRGLEELLRRKDPLLKAERVMARRRKKAKATAYEREPHGAGEENGNGSAPSPAEGAASLLVPEPAASVAAPAEVSTKPVDPALVPEPMAAVPPSQSLEVTFAPPLSIRPAIPALLRYQVWLRDLGRCTWTDHKGQPCEERMMLEVDHLKPWCRGGRHTLDNLRLRCRHHNQMAAEQQLGVAFMVRRRQQRGIEGRSLGVSDSKYCEMNQGR